MPEGRVDTTAPIDTALVGKSNTGNGDVGDAAGGTTSSFKLVVGGDVFGSFDRTAWPTWLREAINYFKKVATSSTWVRVVGRLVDLEESLSLTGSVSHHDR